MPPEGSDDPEEPGIVLNVAGEGEKPDAIDINSLVMPRRSPHTWVRPGRFIQGDIVALPVASAVASTVVGTRLPMQMDEDRRHVVEEAWRVLVRGGTVQLHATTGGGDIWLDRFVAVRARAAIICAE